MKKNRYLPFGYHIQSGGLCINAAEATVVRQTFTDYQGGMSYRLIAEKLTAAAVPYLEHRTDWNKHMVKRMLENRRYCEGDTFPAIVTPAVFAAVAARVGQQGQIERIPEALASIRPKAMCGACGAKFTRDGRSAKYEAWCCTAEGRITDRRISDAALLDKLTAALEVTRTGNQINRELEKSEVDSDYIKLLIFSCAAAKYDACNDREPQHLTQQLRSIFEQAQPLDSFSVQLFDATVKQVLFEPDGGLTLRMNNDKLVHHRAEQEKPICRHKQ